MNIFKLAKSFKAFLEYDRDLQIYYDELRDYCEYINDFVMKRINCSDLNEIPIPQITEKEAIFIKQTFLNYPYPKKLKNLALKLYASTDFNNLLFCANNLRNVQVRRDFDLDRLNEMVGTYDSKNNLIVYNDFESLPHEFLHLASAPVTLNQQNADFSGFRYGTNDFSFGKGINEGYTEMLTRRIFFDENYNTPSYLTNVYAARLFELLYDDVKDMESDYFHANYQGPIAHFIKYGLIEEFFELSKHLDFLAVATAKDGEDIETLKFIKQIILRTEDSKKISDAEDIIDEYCENTGSRPHNRIFSFTKKHHFRWCF